MAFLLSARFLRNFTALARCMNIPTKFTVPAWIPKRQPAIFVLEKNFSTNILPISSQGDSNVDRSLRRLDQEVRRSGRISRRELEDVLEEISHSGSANSTQSLHIIRCCGNLLPEELPSTRTQLVQRIWKTLEALGVLLDISHYNALLRVYLENEHQFSPMEFLAELENKGVEPNRVTYQRLISKYCQEGDIDGATQILEFMRSKDMPVNEHVFNALIMGHSQSGDMQSAVGILNVMKQAGLQPSADTFTTLLCGYAKLGDTDAMNSVIDQCKNEDIQLSDRDYMDVIYTLAVNNHLEHIDKLLGLMQQGVGYNHDAVNLILRLINKKRLDVAKRILYTMTRSVANDHVPTGNFFVRQLIRANIPVEETIAFCRELEQKQLNKKALRIATETALFLGNIEQSHFLLLALKEDGYPVRQHYFWPLIISQAKSSNSEGIMKVLKSMTEEFNLQIGGETLRDYVVPLLFNSIPHQNRVQEIMLLLTSVGVSQASVACTLVHHLLTNNDIVGAYKIANQYRAVYSHNLLRKPLIKAFQHTQDIESFTGLIRHLYESASRLAEMNISSSSSSSNSDEDVGPSLDNSEFVGQLMLDVVSAFHQNKATILKEVLKKLVAQGLSLSNSAAERINIKLSSEELSDEISDLLEKLTSGELQPTELSKPPPIPFSSLNEYQLRSLIQSQKLRGKNVNNIKRQLLSLYCRNKDLEKAEPLEKNLLEEGYVFGTGLSVQLIDLYTHHEKIESALKVLQEIKSHMDFSLDGIRVMKCAVLMVQNGNFEEAVKFIEEHGPCKRNEERGFIYNSTCRKLLNILAERGEVQELQMMFKTLHQLNYIELNNSVLGPLVKVHLIRDDISSALEEFEQCCLKFNCTPWKNELACRLIQSEDAVALQKLTDLSTRVHGEVNSLYDLVFAFVECGRIRQARKILETPGLRSRPQKMNSACEHYRQEGNITSLEGLLDATRDLSYIHRSDIYHHLLLSYCEAKNTEKALGLWTRMQEEDIQLSTEFLVILGNFLKESGLSVPFKIPEELKPQSHSVSASIKEDKFSGSVPTPAVHRFSSAVAKSDFEGAIQIQQMMAKNEKQQISRNDYSTLVKGLVKTSSVTALCALLLDMCEVGIYPMISALQHSVNTIASHGNVDTLNELKKYLSERQKRSVHYNNNLCIAYCASGQSSKYFDDLEREIDKANAEDYKLLVRKVASGEMIRMLQGSPNLCSRYEQIAEKYVSHGMFKPLNVLWTYYMIEHQYDLADKLWNEHLSKCPSAVFRSVTKEVHRKQDIELAQHLVNAVKHSSLSSNSLGDAYGCLIDVSLSVGDMNEARKAFSESKEMGVQNLLNIDRTKLESISKEIGTSVETADQAMVSNRTDKNTGAS